MSEPSAQAVPMRMIKFACRCHHAFSLPEDQAGGVIQCPSCHRLCDIPTLSDLGHIDEEGNYLLEDGIIPLAEPDRLDTLRKTFTRAHREGDEEIDLRPTMQDVMDAGSEEIPLALADEVRPGPPKYDPVTGELIRPLDVKPDDRAHAIGPLPVAKRAVQYATVELSRGFDIGQIGVRLLEPINLFVMACVLFVHLLIQPVNLMMLAGIFLVAPLWIIGVGLLLAHYGCVIEEMGPCERDELPRPLRDAELHADIWRPFTVIVGSVMLCYWPVLVALKLGFPALPLLGVAGICTIALPAVLLTLTASATVLNLRPDRVLGVIVAAGARYWISIALLVAAISTYGLGLWRLQIDTMRLFVPMNLSNVPLWFEPWVAYPALLVGIYLMHWFCWALGAIYRARQEQFPWILQRHVPTRMRDRTQLPIDVQAAAERRGNTNSAAVKRRLR